MAFTISGLSDFTERATEILREGVLFNDNYSEFTVQEGISYKEFVNYLDADPQLVAGSCGATDISGSTLTEKVITVVPMKADNSYCFDDLYKKAVSEDDVAEAITIDTMNKLAYKVEGVLWVGDSLGNDGWIAQASASADTVNLADGTALTSTNIDDKVEAMITATPNALQARDEVKTIYVSYKTYRLYKNNRLAANYYRDADADMGKDEMWVFGYENDVKIKAIRPFTNDQMLMTYGKNLIIGTDEINTVSSAKWVIDEVTEFAWLKSKFKLGTQTGFNAEIVLYV